MNNLKFENCPSPEICKKLEELNSQCCEGNLWYFFPAGDPIDRLYFNLGFYIQNKKFNALSIPLACIYQDSFFKEINSLLKECYIITKKQLEDIK